MVDTFSRLLSTVNKDKLNYKEIKKCSSTTGRVEFVDDKDFQNREWTS